jgi:hypothetical protein
MTNQHPITPPYELIEEWIEQFKRDYPTYYSPVSKIATQAAQWGADQELEACCEWFQEFYKTESWVTHDLKHFRSARRPKPPSLKEQALKALEQVDGYAIEQMNAYVIYDELKIYADTIRRALEQLND